MDATETQHQDPDWYSTVLQARWFNRSNSWIYRLLAFRQHMKNFGHPCTASRLRIKNIDCYTYAGIAAGLLRKGPFKESEVIALRQNPSLASAVLAYRRLKHTIRFEKGYRARHNSDAIGDVQHSRLYKAYDKRRKCYILESEKRIYKHLYDPYTT